jgi:hypothetical protein
MKRDRALVFAKIAKNWQKSRFRILGGDPVYNRYVGNTRRFIRMDERPVERAVLLDPRRQPKRTRSL